MYLSARERLVLDALLKQPLNVQQLAEHLHVSRRTIQRDLERLHTVVEQSDLILSKKTGIGISILGEESQKQALRDMLNDLDILEVTAEERRAFLKASLLRANGALKLSSLASELDVSVVTMSNDLTELTSWLERFELTIVRKRSLGVFLEGAEKSKRLALMQLFIEFISEQELISVIRGHATHFSAVSKKLLGHTMLECVHEVEAVFSDLYEELPYTITDHAYSELVLYMALATKRMENAFYIIEETLSLEVSEEYHLAEKLMQELAKQYDITVEVAEIQQLTIHLRGAKLRHDQQLAFEDLDLRLASQITKFIQCLDDEMNTALSKDHQLFQGLLVHLERAMYRLTHQMPIYNPLLARIQERYAALFETVGAVSERCFPAIHFPDDEIAFLVMHIGAVLERATPYANLSVLVVCSSGLGTSKMLANRLRKEVPEIQHVSTTSLLELSKVQYTLYDVVLSTVPLPINEADYRLISPLLTDEDIANVRSSLTPKPIVVVTETKDALARLREVQQLTTQMVTMLEMFECIELKEAVFEDALEEATSYLQQKKCVNDARRLVGKLLEREQLGGLGMPDSVLGLYHTRTNAVNAATFHVFRLKEPVMRQGMDGQRMPIQTILMLLAPEDISAVALETLSYISTLLVESTETLRLFEQGTTGQIANYIANKFQRYVLTGS